ncbi:MAG: glycosyl hydrolase family 28-related protein [Planctomycetota bacterium]
MKNICVVFGVGGAAVSSASADVAFPDDAGVIDVTDFSFNGMNIRPDDGIDDTVAFQKLLDQTVNDTTGGRDRILYIPDGVYNVSDTLQIPGAARFINLQGQSRDGTVFKLQDNLQGSNASAFNGAIFNFGGGGTADRFENSIRDLTLDIGSGNAGASGLEFNASNQGVARDLLIRSSDPGGAGNIGFDVGYTGTIGPLLVKNLTVEGFDTGIRSQFESNSKVFEDITLRNQNALGWQNSNTATVMVRNLVSENAVPVIDVGPDIDRPVDATDPGNGRIVLVGGSLTGTGGAASEAAIRVRNSVPSVYIRDVETTGYGQAIERDLTSIPRQGNAGLPDGLIEEYWFAGPSNNRRGGTFQAFDNTPDTALGLEIRDTPQVVNEAPDAWVSPTDFDASARPNDGIDDTAAIQAAIDSGARTVYLANGDWTVNGEIQLSGNVERLIGTEASLVTTGGGRVVLGETGADTVVVERISGDLGPNPRVVYEHDSDRTWVFKNVSQWSYDAKADNPGDLYLEDVASGDPNGEVFRNQNVWARQYNNEVLADSSGTVDDVREPSGEREVPEAKITVDNATLWVLGLKTEQAGTIVKTINGGQTELLGVYRNGPQESDETNPAFLTVDSAFSVSTFSIRPGNAGYALFARETRDGVTVDVPDFNIGTSPDDPRQLFAGVYSAFDDEALWNLRQTVYLDNADTRGVSFEGDWQTSTAGPGGFIGEDFVFSRDAGDTATFTPDLPVEGEYEVAVRWVNDANGQNHSDHLRDALIEILTRDGTESITVDQDINGGMWVTLGTFWFAEGEAGQITFRVTGSSGQSLIVDGVRLTLVPEPSTLLGGLVLGGLCLSRGRRRGRAAR